MNPRVVAVKILYQVLEKHLSLNSAIVANLPKNSLESSLIKEFCYGCLRWYFQLQHLLDLLIPKPLKPKDRDIAIIILLGLYQLLYMRVAEHAAVTETVEVARLIKKPWATKLINGVLRNFIRNKADLLQQLHQSVEAKYAHPQWLIQSIRQAWPEQWQEVLQQNNQHPPFCLRINRLALSREQWMNQASDLGVASIEALSYSNSAVLLPAQDVHQLPGFREGQVSVQDAAAQLAATLLELAPQLRVLDACAAPGGKTTHIAETEANLLEIIALDSKADRLEQAKSNWQRLKLTTPISWIAEDANNVQRWWDNQPFDRVLIDAPCSGTGVIRRHPDIKVLRKKNDIAALAKQQYLLLENLWQVLRPGGILVYATCSILPEENTKLVEKFLANFSNATEIKIEENWGIAQTAGRQILPSHEMDGFYYAKIQKIPH